MRYTLAELKMLSWGFTGDGERLYFQPLLSEVEKLEHLYKGSSDSLLKKTK